eukprot:TRINITY_DN10612_c0_g2_i1.p1 TRINITY_DN10612_c0_g2~~TRINITY_DN10612_c0_g2_i1.p1  ORF type:complete len:209 (+),score=-11.34 TRINITY_DN10612_c0_g2_i1:119-745(+)
MKTEYLGDDQFSCFCVIIFESQLASRSVVLPFTTFKVCTKNYHKPCRCNYFSTCTVIVFSVKSSVIGVFGDQFLSTDMIVLVGTLISSRLKIRIFLLRYSAKYVCVGDENCTSNIRCVYVHLKLIAFLYFIILQKRDTCILVRIDAFCTSDLVIIMVFWTWYCQRTCKCEKFIFSQPLLILIFKHVQIFNFCTYFLQTCEYLQVLQNC